MRTVLISEPHAWDSTIQVGGHHYAREFLARGWRVVFVSQALNLLSLAAARRDPAVARAVATWRAGGEVHEGGRLIAYVPLFLVPLGRRLPAAVRRSAHRLAVPRLSAVLRRHGIGRVDLLWLNGAADAWMLDEVPHARSFVRVADDYAGYDEYPAHLGALLERVVRQADVAACASEPVRRSLARIRPDVRVVRNGVVFSHFDRAGADEPADLAAIPGPRAVYVGALSYWFDWELLAQVAAARPGVSFVVIGPGHAAQVERPALPANVHLLGRRGYDGLPRYLAHCQAGIIPFRRTRLVDGVSPIKAYEYLAAGLPVVSTRWTELEEAGVPVHLATGAADFAGRLDAALAEGPGRRSAYREYARRNTWSERFEQVMELCFPQEAAAGAAAGAA